MTTALRRATIALLLSVGCAQAQAPVDLRVALVIGNAAYATAPLLNPANDARAMGEVLRAMGFTVIEARDASKAQMQQALTQAGAALKGRNGVGMLYYAGHGLQLDWHNYMVPVDARFSNAAEVPAQTVDVQAVIDAFRSAGNRMNILVLDACRDNPFAATASAKGLAPMDAPPGTLLAYATAPGNVAEDGDAKSGNGLYTRFLVKEIGNPAAKIEDVFKRVRLQVRRQSDGRQVPWESTSLEEDFFFGPHTRPDKTGDGEQLQQVADALLREKVDWDRIKTSSKADDLYAFLQKYPNGLISEQAQFRLDQLQRPKVAAQPGANGVKVLASGTNRYLVGDEWTVERTDHLANTVRLLKRRVTRADDEQVVVNNGGIILDQMGGTVRNGTGTKEPPLLNAPSDLAVGKRWRSAFINTHTDGMKTANFYDFRVQALEDITVPAGRFKAYRVERNGQAEHSNGRLKVMTGAIWIDPATMVVVQSESQHRVRGKLVEHQSDRLVELKRVPREGRS